MLLARRWAMLPQTCSLCSSNYRGMNQPKHYNRIIIHPVGDRILSAIIEYHIDTRDDIGKARVVVTDRDELKLNCKLLNDSIEVDNDRSN
jgi:hypothetical protein